VGLAKADEVGQIARRQSHEHRANEPARSGATGHRQNTRWSCLFSPDRRPRREGSYLGRITDPVRFAQGARLDQLVVQGGPSRSSACSPAQMASAASSEKLPANTESRRKTARSCADHGAKAPVHGRPEGLLPR
jgi:hypothetical protein